MTKVPFAVLSADKFIEHIVKRVEASGAAKEAAFALLLGSGFSYPLVPTAKAMVEKDVAWFTYAQRNGLDYCELVPTEHTDKLKEHSIALWKNAHEVKLKNGDDPFELDESTQLPRLTGDNVSSAYLAVMSGHCTMGLSDPGARLQYFRAACRKIGKQLNLAHIYLGSLLHAQSTADWRNARRPLVRNLFTTNFDPLLQRTAQLHNVLYFMSDQPEGGIAVPDDSVDSAVHFVYTHGSVHRRFLANNPTEIGNLGSRNSAALTNYFERHGVIVIGYSGWADTAFEALNQCAQFDGNLYWCGRESATVAANGALRSDACRLLEKDTNNRFYVETGDAGADGLMRRLHFALMKQALPIALDDPLSMLIDELEQVSWPDDPDPELKQLKDMAKSNLDYLMQERDRGVAEPAETVDVARLNRDAMRAYFQQDFQGQVNFLTQIIEAPEASIEQKAKALLDRGVAKGKLSPPDLDGKIEDYTAVIEMNDAPIEQTAKALYYRGITKGKISPPDFDGEIEDYTAVIEMNDAPIEQTAMALLNRGFTKGQLSPPDFDGEIEDYTAVIEMNDAPIEQTRMALYNRGYTKGQLSPPDLDGKIEDYTAVIEMNGAPIESIAKALINRGNSKGLLSPPDRVGQLEDYTAVIEMNNAPIEQTAKALNGRGITKGLLSPPDRVGQLEDFTAVTEMPDASKDRVAIARFNLACHHAQACEVDAALKHLQEWKSLGLTVSQSKVDSDSDFDAIRSDPRFINFREGLASE